MIETVDASTMHWVKRGYARRLVCMEPGCEFEVCAEFPAHEGRLLCHAHHPAGDKHHDTARCSSIIHPEDRGEPVIVMSVGVMEGVRFIQYEPDKPNYLEVTRDIARSS